MRPLMPADLECATRSLLALPEGRWPGKARHLIARAERADRRRRELGRIDPVVGNGTLMAAALMDRPPPLPELCDARYCAALATLLDALDEHWQR